MKSKLEKMNIGPQYNRFMDLYFDLKLQFALHTGILGIGLDENNRVFQAYSEEVELFISY